MFRSKLLGLLTVGLGLLVSLPASAQTGSAKTQAQLNTEINSLFPDNVHGLITPFDARQVTLDQVATMFGGPVSPLVTPTADGQNSLFQNGSKSAFNIYGPAAPANLFDYDNVRSVIDIEAGTTVQNYNAYGAWIWDNQPWTPTLPNNKAGVGYEAYCVAAVASAGCFGFNPAVTDSYDGTTGHSVAATLVGTETDITTDNAGTVATGHSIVLQGAVQAGVDGIELTYNSATTARYSNGYTIDDGALKNGGAGLLLGTQGVASGTNILSGSVIFNVLDSGGSEHHVTLQGIPNGTAAQLSLTDGGSSSGFVAGSLLLTPVTISALPACTSGLKGTIAFVSDTTASGAASYHGTVTGSGATTVNSPVSCTGSVWQYD